MSRPRAGGTGTATPTHPAAGHLDRAGALLVHAGFFLVGVATVLLGPAIPELAAGWGVPPVRLAPLFVAQYAASGVGSVLAGLDPRRGLLAAYPLVALGLAGLALGGPGTALAATACLGCGLGLAIPASHLLIAAHRPLRRGAALSVLNLVWGFGAVSCPLLFAALRGREPVAGLLLGLAASLCLLAVAYALALRRAGGGRRAVVSAAAVVGGTGAPGGEAGEAEAAEAAGAAEAGGAAASDAGAEAAGASARVRPWELLPWFVLLFLYVGGETAAAGWLVARADQVGGATAASMLVSSAFWGAILTGRGLAPAVLRRLSERALHAIALAVAALGAGGLLVAASRPGLTVAAVLCGLGMSVVYPLTISALSAATEGRRTRGLGWVFAGGSIGGAVLPWLAGELAAAGSLQAGFAVPLAAVLLHAALVAAVRFRRGAAAPRTA